MQALNVNAYCQRAKETCTLAFDPAKALELWEHLRIVIRSDPIADNDPDDKFLMDALNALHMQDVPMKAQSTWHLSKLASKYAAWLEAQEFHAELSEFKFEKDDLNEEHVLASDNDGDG